MPTNAQVSQAITEVAFDADGGSNAQVGQTVAEVVWSSNAMTFGQVSQDTLEVAFDGGGGADVQVGQNVLEVVWAEGTDDDDDGEDPPVEPTDEQTPSIYYYDERDGRIYSVVLPPKPAEPESSTAEETAEQVASLQHTASVGSTIDGTVTADGTWHVVGVWNSVEFNTAVFGTPSLRLNSSAQTEAGHGVYCDLGEGNEADLSDATLTFQTVTYGVEDRTGWFLALVAGEDTNSADDWKTQIYPFEIPANAASTSFTLSGGVREITIRVADFATPDSALNAVRYVGFMVTDALGGEFVVSMKDLRFKSGLTGEHRYKIRDTRVQGWQMPVNTENILPSPEAPGPDDDDLIVTAGSSGSSITLTRASIPEDLAWWEIYRSDTDETGRYHWVANWPSKTRWQPETEYAVGDIMRPPTLDEGRSGDYQFWYTCTTAGTSGDRDEAHTWPVVALGTITTGTAVFTLATADDKENVLVYVDTEQDIADNPLLEEDRVHVPVPATSIGVYDNRLVLYVTDPAERVKKPYVGSLWLSGRGNHADWHDWGPESWPELEVFNQINDASACRMPVSEAGQVMAMTNLGAWTGAAYTGPLLLSTLGGQFVALQGTVPSLNPEKDGFSLGHRARGGASGPYAACKDGKGNALVATPDGDVVIVNRTLEPERLSRAIENVLREADDDLRIGWLVGYDAYHSRVVLWTGQRLFALDMDKGDGGGGWDELSTAVYGVPVVMSAKPGNGGHLIVARGRS